MTETERRILSALKGQRWLTPSEIGYAMTPDREWPLKAQGAGRIGGGMAARLIRKGLVRDVSFLRGGFPAYRITAKGLKEIEQTKFGDAFAAAGGKQ